METTFNIEFGEGLPATMRGFKPKPLTLQPPAANQLTEPSALVRSYETYTHRVRVIVRRFIQSPVAWLLATLAIVGLLAAMLIVGIAISV